MIRGYDSGYDSWVWFVGMIRGPWFSVSLHPPRIVIYPHLPRKCFQLLVIIRYVERFGAGMLLTLCVLLSEWCVRFGVGMLVPLQDAAAGCCCRIFLRSSRRRSVARCEWLQRKELTKHKFWSCKCTKVQNLEVWGMIQAWFGVWFGNPFFFEFGKLCCLSLFFPPSTYYDCYLMAAMARPARRPWTGPECEECEDLNAHLWFISAGLPASLPDVLLMYL